jgi:hypothetical protein
VKDDALFTAAQEIADYRQVKPHLVILGAGASRAALPDGDARGRHLPVMADFVEIVPVVPILEKSGIHWEGRNFEEIYSDLSQRREHAPLKAELEQTVFDYFADLRLPDVPTIYDSLVLSLRKKDVIATFNWDPFLIQAFQRSAAVTNSLPTLLFLHGNVAHGYCDRDRCQGPRGGICPRCGEPLKSDQLLFPIAKKDYSADPAISKAWEVTRAALKDALVVTVFGYSAPSSDKDALSMMTQAWGKPANRQLELFEIIDIKPRDEVRTIWKEFIFSGHYRVVDRASKSFLTIHPRRSIEAFLNQYIHAHFLEGNRVIKAQTLDELHAWFEPLLRAEQKAAP